MPTVLHVSQPVDAGVPGVLLSLAADELARGWEVHVACPVDESPLAEKATALGARVHPWAATRSPGPSVADETRRLVRIVAEVDPDVVVLHSSKAGLAGRLAVRGSRPTIFMPHSWSFEAVTGPVERASRLWERLGARWTDVTLCVSQAEADLGRRHHCIGSRAVVIPNGVDLQAWTPGNRALARERLGLDPQAPLAVIVGRLARQKGQDVALAAWRQVTDQLPQARLALVGDGPDRADLEHQADGVASVTFVGRADPHEWLAAADVVGLSSRWEGMPLVLLEAMAAGRSVVSTDVAGAREALALDEAIVPVEDPDALARALLARLGDPALAHAEGERNRHRAEENLDVRQAQEKVAHLVLDLVASRAGRHR